MELLHTSFLLICLSVAIKIINSHSDIPGRCDFINYCAHLRQAHINPVGNHPATCPDPNICNRELDWFGGRPQRKFNLKVLPVDDEGYDEVKVFTGCQFEPHCGRIPVKRPTTELWPGARYKVPVRCNFVDYCDSLRQYKLHPIGSHPGTCPDPSICGREVESFTRRKESKTRLQIFPNEDPHTCKTCDRPAPKNRKIPEHIDFVAFADPDLLPGTCGELKHCGRVPKTESRKPKIETSTTSAFPSSCEGKIHCERKPQHATRPAETPRPIQPRRPIKTGK